MSDETQEVVQKPQRKLYTVKEFIDAEELRADLSFSVNDLTSAMMTQASRLVEYGIKLSKASKQVDDLKMMLQTVEARVYRQLRDKALVASAIKDDEEPEEKGKRKRASASDKLTEAQLSQMVASEEVVIKVNRLLNEAKQIESIAKVAVESFRHRRDMLVQMGMLSREEMKGEVSISRRNAAHEQQSASQDRIRARLRGDEE